MKKTPLENRVEKALVSAVKSIGGKCIKMIPTYEAGIPDRLVLYKGRTIFVELKKEGQNPRKLQMLYMKELNDIGFETQVIDSVDEVKKFIIYLGDLN